MNFVQVSFIFLKNQYKPFQSDELQAKFLLVHWKHIQGYSKPQQNWVVFQLLSGSMTKFSEGN